MFLFICSRHASELDANDILMLTVFTHNIFPYTSQVTPQVYNRTPPQQAHHRVKTGDPSLVHPAQEGPSSQEDGPKERAQSAPVRVPPRKHKEDSPRSVESSADDKFYSPPSTPPLETLEEAVQSSGLLKETFFTPRATTPDRHLTSVS